jgi:DNA adenine methylase
MDYTIQKPLIKWVGGKHKLLHHLLTKFPTTINNYHELFLGGGSVLLGILSAQENKKITIKGKLYAYDSNPVLIGFYKAIQSNWKELYDTIMKIKKAGEKVEDKEYYYYIRQLYNSRDDTDMTRIAEFVYLNKTCFRGIFRLNKSGGFNVPYGNYKNPKIADPIEFEKVSKSIQNVEFICSDFEKVNIRSKKDFVYMDPPYVPEKKDSFVAYDKVGFTEEKHNALFDKCVKMTCKWMMSNSNTEPVREKLKKFNIVEIEARRAINSKNPAAKTKEVVVYN